MTIKSLSKKALCVIVSAAFVMAFALTGCSSDPYAAKVNGVEIKESKITKYIEQIRESYSLTDDQGWANYLSQSSMTPSSLRDQILDSYIQQEIVKQCASEKDCAATDDEIDEQVSKMKKNYEDDSSWSEALKNAGFDDENAYREILKYSVAYEKLGKKFAEDATVEDSTVLEECQSKADTLNGGKKSSHILFNSDDEEKAKQVLAKIRSGELDFAEAAKQYSEDSSSADEGGNVGWDKENSFVTAYTDALNQLQVGEMSDLVTSDYGIHIIKCTETFTKPEKTDALTDFPEEYVNDMRESCKETQGETDLSSWIDEKKNEADIDKKDMPSNVSYNVDMSKYETTTDNTSSDDSSTETNTEDSGDASTDESTEASTESTDASNAEGTAADTATEGQ